MWLLKNFHCHSFITDCNELKTGDLRQWFHTFHKLVKCTLNANPSPCDTICILWEMLITANLI